MSWVGTETLALFGVGILIGFINSLAGGGSFLSLPLLIFLGLPGSVANGTNRLSALFLNVSASLTYRTKHPIDSKTLIKVLPATFLGAFTGAIIAVDIPDELFNKILASIMIVVLVFMLKKPNPKTQKLAKNSFFAIPVFFLVGMYGGFLQAGAGFLILAALHHFFGFDFLKGNAFKAMLVGTYSVIPVSVFIYYDKVLWSYALPLAFGALLGGYLGPKWGMKQGPTWVKWFVVGCMILFSAKLLLF